MIRFGRSARFVIGVAVLVVVGLAARAVVAQRAEGQRGQATAQQYPPGQCPPGTTETRPGRCQAPEFPAPSILDYKPRSTLVTPEHLVPKAKYPVIDIHSHTGPTAATIERLIKEMDALGLRVLVNLSGGVSTRRHQAEGGLHPREQVPRSVPRVRQRGLERRRRPGLGREGGRRPRAVGHERRRRPEDRQEPRAAREEGRRHPAEGGRSGAEAGVGRSARASTSRCSSTPPNRRSSSRRSTTRTSGGSSWRCSGTGGTTWTGEPTFEELMGERDRMFLANPKTRFINAHFGWYGNDLARAAKFLDARPTS